MMILDPPRLLDELCTRFSICLDPAGRSRIAIGRFADLDSLEAAILQSEGLDPLRLGHRLRHDLRQCLDRHVTSG